MIDNVATPNPAANLLTNSAPAPTSAGTPGQGPQTAGDAAPAESFATALQSRLKQASINKPAPRGNTENAGDAAEKLKGLLQALNAEKPANPMAQVALTAHEAGENPAAAVLEAIAARLAGKDKQEEAETPSPTVTSDTVTTPVTPLAVNAVALTPTPSVAPVVPPADTEQKSANTGATLPAAPPTADEQAAILAVASDKKDAAPANTDRPQDKNTFSDLMKNAAPVPAAAVNTHAHNAVPVVREVGTPVSSPQWSNDVGNQVSWMVSQRESRADLVLNPPQLGRIEVSISLNGDQATASFISPNADVRDALQGSLPRLREILADAGVFLGQADIGAESSQQFSSGAEKGTKSGGDSISSPNSTLLGSSSLLASESSAGVKRGHGLIDLFA